MKTPIRYSPRQVSLMLTVARFYDPGFAAGVAAPTAKIAQAFGLQKTGKWFIWEAAK
jgi:hypothetical protein